MQQWPASKRDQQQCNPVLDTENIRTAILAAIFTIELNCGEIAKPQRIARGLKGLHQNPGKSTNCKRTFPIAPESASFRNRNQGSERNPPKTEAMPAQSFAILGIVVELQIPGDPIAILFQATPEATGLQSTQNLPYFATHLSSSSRIDPKNDSNQHNQTGSQLDCRSTKDCNVIGRIALKLYGFHTNPAVHAQSDKSRQNKRPRG